MSTESQNRKAQSILLLTERGVPYIEHLPEIEDSSEATLRSPSEIGERARCLIAVCLAVNMNDRPAANGYNSKHNLTAKHSPLEQKLFSTARLSQQDRANFSWQCEALVMLIWSLGMIDGLPPPSECVNAESLLQYLETMEQKFWNGVHARPVGEILDQCDLYYRYHWAARDASLNDQSAPAGLNLGAISERHRALNWLVSNEWENWDEVATDT